MEKIKEYISKYKIFIIGGLSIILVIGSYIYINCINNDGEIEKEIFSIGKVEKQDTKKEDKQEVKKHFTIDIKGQVNNPGVYNVEEGLVVNDVIKLAGGLNKYADTSVNNLSKKVIDEMVIIIYSKNEVKNFTKVKEQEQIKQEKCVESNISTKNDSCINNDITNDSKQGNSVININTADVSMLTSLSGIGESRAEDIISYRNQNGLFKTIDDLKNVKGIGDTLFDKIKESITI